MTIKAITFDFWSTLYKAKAVDYTARLERLKSQIEAGSGAEFNQEQFEAAIKVARDIWSKTWIEEHRTIDAQEWLSIIINELGTTFNPDDLQQIQIYMENSVLHNRPTLATEVKSVLKTLSAAYKVAIISDTGITPGRTLRQILEEDQLLNYFTHLTFSDEIGHSKPHPNAFLTTLKALNATPAEAVHIGDLLRTDIAGALAVGMRAVQFIGINHDKGQALKETVTPNAVISNHQELIPLLQNW